MNKRFSVRNITVTALFMAMTVIMSMSIFSVPVPGGHLYFCDAVICVAAILLDPFEAFMVGGVGSFIGDFLFYPAPMFVSLVSHGLQAVIISLVVRKLFRGRPLIGKTVGVTLGSIVMVVGYTLGRAFVYATPAAAIAKLPFEFLQAAIGAVAGVLITIKYKPFFEENIK